MVAIGAAFAAFMYKIHSQHVEVKKLQQTVTQTITSIPECDVNVYATAHYADLAVGKATRPEQTQLLKDMWELEILQETSAIWTVQNKLPMRFAMGRVKVFGCPEGARGRFPLVCGQAQQIPLVRVPEAQLQYSNVARVHAQNEGIPDACINVFLSDGVFLDQTLHKNGSTESNFIADSTIPAVVQGHKTYVGGACDNSIGELGMVQNCVLVSGVDAEMYTASRTPVFKSWKIGQLSLLLAHEFAHSFGAKMHDEEPVCSKHPDNLMRSHYTAAGTNQRMSPCALAAIRSFLDAVTKTERDCFKWS